jgi:hypothetical protein
VITVRKVELDSVIEGVVGLTRDLARVSDAVKGDTSDGHVEIAMAQTHALEILNQLRELRRLSIPSPVEPHPSA